MKQTLLIFFLTVLINIPRTGHTSDYYTGEYNNHNWTIGIPAKNNQTSYNSDNTADLLAQVILKVESFGISQDKIKQQFLNNGCNRYALDTLKKLYNVDNGTQGLSVQSHIEYGLNSNELANFQTNGWKYLEDAKFAMQKATSGGPFMADETLKPQQLMSDPVEIQQMASKEIPTFDPSVLDISEECTNLIRLQASIESGNFTINDYYATQSFLPYDDTIQMGQVGAGIVAGMITYGIIKVFEKVASDNPQVTRSETKNEQLQKELSSVKERNHQLKFENERLKENIDSEIKDRVNAENEADEKYLANPNAIYYNDYISEVSYDEFSDYKDGVTKAYIKSCYRDESREFHGRDPIEFRDDNRTCAQGQLVSDLLGLIPIIPDMFSEQKRRDVERALELIAQLESKISRWEHVNHSLYDPDYDGDTQRGEAWDYVLDRFDLTNEQVLIYAP